MKYNIDTILQNLREKQSQNGCVTSDDISEQLVANNVSILQVQDVMDAIRTSGLIINTPTSTDTSRKRQENFKFSDIDIFVGNTLVFTKDPSRTCMVISDKKVMYQNEEYYLSGLAKKLLNEMGYNWQSVRGPSYFRTPDNEDTLDIRYQKKFMPFSVSTDMKHISPAPTQPDLTGITVSSFVIPDTPEEQMVKVSGIDKSVWQKALDFGEQNDYVTPVEKGVLAYLFRFHRVSDKQAKVLLKFLARLSKKGFVID